LRMRASPSLSIATASSSTALAANNMKQHGRVRIRGGWPAGGPAWRSDDALWAEYLLDHENGKRIVLLAFDQGKPAGERSNECLTVVHFFQLQYPR
jgi:hypothetical protein